MRSMHLLAALSHSVAIFGVAGIAGAAPLPHFDLEMTSREYQPLVDKLLEAEDDSSPELRRILEIGKRNLEWIDHLNSRRDPGRKLELSSAALQNGYPIETPTFSNEQLILERYNQWLASTDAAVTQVLLGTGAYPDHAPLDDQAFLTVARAIDAIYQRSSRWLLQQPWLDEYKAAQKNDIRGYYFLNREPDLATTLAGWSALDDAVRARLKPLLVGQCFNDEDTTLAGCEADLSQAAQQGDVGDFFRRYQPTAKALWDAFFVIPVRRTDITWTAADPNAFRVPFRDPQNAPVLNWLRDNIEDEFRWNGWQLRFDFVDDPSDYVTHIEFEAGATPHVNELGGSIITMDANRSLGEYSSRWTIRHEYGHVLGFPDCYVEFYDVTAQAMVQYQLDIENLMCSRRGKLQQRHYDELKRVYYAAE